MSLGVLGAFGCFWVFLGVFVFLGGVFGTFLAFLGVVGVFSLVFWGV